MWRTAISRAAAAAAAAPPSRRTSITSRLFSGGSSGVAAAAATVNSFILRSLKEHYTQISKMTPPPKVSPPSQFTVVKGALEDGGPVLKRAYEEEEINISVMRMSNLFDVEGDNDGDDDINQLFLHAEISKPGQEYAIHFLCGLYPDALGIHSVSLRMKAETSGLLNVPSKYNGPVFENLDERMRDALHGYIEERGVDHNLFPFLQAWLYVKDHRNLLRWFKTVGTCVSDHKPASDS